MKAWNWDKDYKYISIDELVGQTIVSITIDKESTFIYFRTDTGRLYQMFHAQDCCEDVYIESIAGDIDNLIGTPILFAEETSKEIDSYEAWTFYKISTIKGNVTIRWIGTSNGYYGMEVDFAELLDKEKWEA